MLYAQRNPGRLLSLILEDSGPEAHEGLSTGLQRILAELERTPLSFPDFDAARAFWRSIRPDVTEGGDPIAHRQFHGGEGRALRVAARPGGHRRLPD